MLKQPAQLCTAFMQDPATDTTMGTSLRRACKLPSYVRQFSNLQIKVKIKPHSLSVYEIKKLKSNGALLQSAGILSLIQNLSGIQTEGA